MKNNYLPENIESVIGLPEGGRVKVEVIYSEAAASAKIDLLMRQPVGMTILEYANHNIGFQWESEVYGAGTNIEFGIYWSYNHWGVIYEGNEAGAVIEQLNSRQYQIGYEAAGDDWDYNELVILVTIEDYELLVEIEPAVIGAGEEAIITVKKQYMDGRVEEFPAGQIFEAGMMEGCAAGGLINGTDTVAYINGITQPIKFVAADSLENEEEMVRIGVGLLGTGEGIIMMKQKSENKIREKMEIQEETNTELIIGEYCFPGNFVSDRVGEGNLVVEKGGCDEGAPNCTTEIKAPLGFSYRIEYKNKINKSGFQQRDLCKISSGSGFTWIRYDNWITLYEDQPPYHPIPQKDEFYSPFIITTCFNRLLYNGVGAYQYEFKSTNESEDSIYINFIISECNNFSKEIRSESQLNSIPVNEICKALKDFELGRYRQAEVGEPIPSIWEQNNVQYYIIDVIYEHEKYHVRDATRYANENYNKYKFTVKSIEGSHINKSLKEHLETKFKCSESIKNYEDAKQKGEKYITSALKEFMNFHKRTWYAGTVQINFEGEKIYRIRELFAHWSDSVQNKITQYQNILIRREGFDASKCDYHLKNWDPFKIYRNNL